MHTSSMFSIKSSLPCSDRETSFPMQCCRPPLIAMRRGSPLPSRGKYSAVSNDWQVALNYLYASDYAPSEALWFSLPDVAVSVLLTRKVPVIVDAFKLVPHGKLFDLKPIRLGGEIGRASCRERV